MCRGEKRELNPTSALRSPKETRLAMKKCQRPAEHERPCGSSQTEHTVTCPPCWREASGPLAKGEKGEKSGGRRAGGAGEAPGARGEEPRSEGPRPRGHPGAPPRAQPAGGAAAVALRAASQSHEPPPSFPGTPRPRMARPGCACTQGGCGRTIERGRGNPAAAGREHPFAGALRRRGADVTAARPAAERDGGPAGTGAPGPAGGTGAASLPAPCPPGAAEAPLHRRPRDPRPLLPRLPALAGSAGVGAAQRAGCGDAGRPAGLPAALCGSPSVLHRLPCARC